MSCCWTTHILHAAAKRRKHGAAEDVSDEEELSEDRGFARPPVPPRSLQGQPSTSGPAAGAITSLSTKIHACCRALPTYLQSLLKLVLLAVSVMLLSSGAPPWQG